MDTAALRAIRLGYVNLGGVREATWSPLLQVCRDAVRDHHNFDILCVVETWFHSVDCASAWVVDGYQPQRGEAAVMEGFLFTSVITAGKRLGLFPFEKMSRQGSSGLNSLVVN